jgi:pimeloyl-ACP methyl ester carboxylesterase
VPEARVNGVTLYYEEHGEGAPILGIHGSGSSAVLWEDAAAELGKHGRTIVYDRRGFGRSERPEPLEVDVHVHADDAAALLDVLGATPAILIGRSYGADVAVDLALRRPEAVRALVLMEGLENVSPEGRRWLAGLTDEVLAAAETGPDAAVETTFRSVLGDRAWEGLPDPVKQVFIANGPALVAELRGGFPDVGAEQLGAILRPALVVTGEDSPPHYAGVTDALAEALPSGRAERVPGGHIIDPAHPVVLAFVDEVLAAA